MAMKIELHEIRVGDVCNGYRNLGENGVFGYGGNLDIRPQYQRNFIYDAKQQAAVIRTVKNNFPLNIMYWVVRDDGTYEVMDGQQRTISICDYVKGGFSVDEHYFQSLSEKVKQTIMDYKLMVYFCQGDDDEKLDWFKVVNIAGEKLYDQEIRNATYAGKFVNEARAYFSQHNCPAYRKAKEYLTGQPIRQDYLETALEWISDAQGVTVEAYMSQHKHGDAEELWEYFNHVIEWVKWLFPKYYRELKGLNWGEYFNKYGKKKFDVEKISRQVEELRADDEVQSMSGIYKYILTGDEKYLNLRAFDRRTKHRVYERQNHKCARCGKVFEFEQMEGDHITPWSRGGKTTEDNCQMLCTNCNRRKSDE